MAVIGVVVANGFEQADMTAVLRGLVEAGLKARVISTKKHTVRSWDNTHWNGDIPVDVAAVDATLDGVSALALPGGLLSADTLRSDDAVVRLAATAARHNRPVAAMGHSVWVLIEAGLVKGRSVTSHPAIRTDVENAGGLWRDEPVVVDGPVISGRHGHDIGAFTVALARATATSPL